MTQVQQIDTSSDAKLHRKIKTALIIVTIVFSVHAAPRGLMREWFPVIRWSMFSGIGYYALDPAIRYELNIIDAEGGSRTILYTDVPHSSTGFLYEESSVPDHDVMAYKILTKALHHEDPAVREHYQSMLLKRIREYYNIDLDRVEIWQNTYEVQIESLPFIDWDNPNERVLAAEWTEG